MSNPLPSFLSSFLSCCLLPDELLPVALFLKIAQRRAFELLSFIQI
ncbi:MAG: hypothetical protein F6K31_10395 [Symploca sp. SIO2G7]|nr:hypothetical protein [Symploca sp. SIO2G7]